MLEKLKGILMKQIHESEDDNVESRRRHTRRSADQCVCEIDGRMFPVQNWSLGGALVFGDDRPFGAGQEVEVTMKFKLRSIIIDIKQKASIIRKSNGLIAMQYTPLSETVKTKFQQVIDDCVAREFAFSQA